MSTTARAVSVFIGEEELPVLDLGACQPRDRADALVHVQDPKETQPSASGRWDGGVAAPIVDCLAHADASARSSFPARAE